MCNTSRARCSPSVFASLVQSNSPCVSAVDSSCTLTHLLCCEARRVEPFVLLLLFVKPYASLPFTLCPLQCRAPGGATASLQRSGKRRAPNTPTGRRECVTKHNYCNESVPLSCQRGNPVRYVLSPLSTNCSWPLFYSSPSNRRTPC